MTGGSDSLQSPGEVGRVLPPISLRGTFGPAAFCWMLNHLVVGSVGGTLAEAMVIVTNIITIIRLYRLRQRFPDIID